MLHSQRQVALIALHRLAQRGAEPLVPQERDHSRRHADTRGKGCVHGSVVQTKHGSDPHRIALGAIQ